MLRPRLPHVRSVSPSGWACHSGSASPGRRASSCHRLFGKCQRDATLSVRDGKEDARKREKVRGRAGTPQAQQGSARPAASCAFSRSPDGDGPWRSSALPDPAASWPQFCPARGAPSPGSSPLSLISEPALHAPRLNTRLLLDGPPRIPRHCPIDARGAASMGTARATTQRNEGAIEGSQCS